MYSRCFFPKKVRLKLFSVTFFDSLVEIDLEIGVYSGPVTRPALQKGQAQGQGAGGLYRAEEGAGAGEGAGAEEEAVTEGKRKKKERKRP